SFRPRTTSRCGFHREMFPGKGACRCRFPIEPTESTRPLCSDRRNCARAWRRAAHRLKHGIVRKKRLLDLLGWDREVERCAPPCRSRYPRSEATLDIGWRQVFVRRRRTLDCKYSGHLSPLAAIDEA